MISVLKIVLGIICLMAGYRLSPFFPDTVPIASGLGFALAAVFIHDAFARDPMFGGQRSRWAEPDNAPRRPRGFPTFEQMRADRERWPNNPERWSR
jgi:hypothetical protein